MSEKKEYKSAFFKIIAITNLHVGSGDNNYGIIDNLVQRDHITNLPIINSSSLKGALRAFCEYSEKFDNTFVDTVFGSKMRDPEENETEKKENKEKAKKQQAGKFRFFDAKLLAMPVQSPNENKMFDMISSQDVKDELNSDAKLFKTNINVESILMDVELVDNLKQKSSDFELPVIARNQLNNGESKNLWYEQVVPRESQFYFIVLYPSEMQSEFENLKKSIEPEAVQIGANASIGYGFCDIKEILNGRENDKR